MFQIFIFYQISQIFLDLFAKNMKGWSLFSLDGIPGFKLTAFQEPEQWGPEMYDEEGVEQANEVILILYLKKKLLNFTFSECEATQLHLFQPDGFLSCIHSLYRSCRRTERL